MSHPAQLKVPEGLVFGEAGLIPVIVQDRLSGDVLMLAWTNAEALASTVRTGQAHFWSRSRQSLWRKGATSGNLMLVRDLRTDCDRDVVLMAVEPEGPACHEGTRTCFGEDTPTKAGVLAELMRVVGARLKERPPGSYTGRLAEKGLDHTLRKVGEEAAELIIAAKAESDLRLAEEAADLVFHVLVALGQRGVSFSRVLDVLRERRGAPQAVGKA